MGVELCSPDVASMSATVRNRSQPFATVRNRSQPFATVRKCPREVRMAVPIGSSAKGALFRVFQLRVASFRVADVALAFQHVSRRVKSGFAWQAQYFCNIFRSPIDQVRQFPA